MWPWTKRSILVTGSHRSGTTWVGEMICCHPNVSYLYEPFNFTFTGTPVRYWFHHVTAAEEAAFRRYLDPMLLVKPFDVPGGEGLRAWWSRSHWRPLLKDPIALFSAEWLARVYAMDVVVMIRHPAAFASSLMRLGWTFDFNEFVKQSELMRRFLSPFEEEIRHFAQVQQELLEQACLLWRAMHYVIRQYQAAHPDWIFLRHEDLSLDPRGGFGRLFTRLRLPTTAEVMSRVEEHSSSENPQEAAAQVVHQLKRDSRANIWSWKNRLTPAEILRIRKATEDVCVHFYGDEDWGPSHSGKLVA